jgi:hypothetical protein
MIDVLALGLACLMTGSIVGWILRTAVNMTELAWWQRRMQRQLRHWQSEAIHARAVAEHLNRQLAAVTGRDLSLSGWPFAAADGEDMPDLPA